jgi:hypothetical protein
MLDLPALLDACRVLRRALEDGDQPTRYYAVQAVKPLLLPVRDNPFADLGQPPAVADAVRGLFWELNECGLWTHFPQAAGRVAAAVDRLLGVAGPPAPADPFADLLAWAAAALAGTKRRALRRVVELLCANGGACHLATLGTQDEIRWAGPDYESAYRGVSRRINAKLARTDLPWRLKVSGRPGLVKIPAH